MSACSFPGHFLGRPGLPFLALGGLLGVVGVFTLASSGAWAVTVGSGGGPAYFFLLMALEDRNSSLPTCGEMVHKEGITVVGGCTPSTLGYIVLLAFFGLVALSGPAARLIMRWRAQAS